MFDDNKITLRLWFFEVTIKYISKDSFVGKRNLAFFVKNKKVFKV